MNNSTESEFKCGCSGLCGGCFYRNESLQEELDAKEATVKKLISESWGGDFEFEGILQSPAVSGYRNKMEYSFGDCRKDGPLTLGLHQKKSFYNVLDITDCQIVHEDFNRIVRAAGDYFREKAVTYMNKKSHTGYLRYLIVRRTANTEEILIDLVTSSQAPAEEKVLLAGFCEKMRELPLQGRIRGILHTTNDTLSDAVRDDGTVILYGENHIEETVLGLRFNITSFSFFQTNTKGAELLYTKAREYISLSLNRSRTVYDLYSGTGTIAQVIAPSVKKVVGVEIVEEAVGAARENAAKNGLDNCEFLAGDVLETLDHIPEKPDVIILDPPREGVNPKALRKIIAYGADTVLYISCKPDTLARDLVAFRAAGYAIEKSVSINQFPRTRHVETIVLLSRKDMAQE